MKTQAILFDLDGTLLDTAPDLLYAFNLLRQEYDLPELSMPTFKEKINGGTKAMLELAFDFPTYGKDYQSLRHKFTEYYLTHITRATCYFPTMDTILQYLDEVNMPWGIVTNKSKLMTMPLLKALKLDLRAKTIVCGDTLACCKPDPLPIIHACKTLKVDPVACIYVGDAYSDVMASKAAGTTSLVALYGYIRSDEDPLSWQADGYLHRADEIKNWI